MHTYDDNGNTLTETDGADVTTYAYDARNKLVQATTPSETITYQYAPNGLRTQKATSGATIDYLVDSQSGYGDVVAEYVNGSKAKTYAIGDDLISQTVGNATFYYGYDGLGSTRMLFADTGTVSDSYDYTAFGEIHGQSGSTDNTFLFTGEQFDSNVGQYYLRARYYNQAIGRFTQLDTYQGRMSDPATLHKYLYTGNDPVNMIDPSGHMTMMNVSISLPTMSISATAANFALGRLAQFSIQMVLREQLIQSRVVAATRGVQNLSKGVRILNKQIRRFFKNKKVKEALKINKLDLNIDLWKYSAPEPAKTAKVYSSYRKLYRKIRYRFVSGFKAGRLFGIDMYFGELDKATKPSRGLAFRFRVDYLDYVGNGDGTPKYRPRYHISYPGYRGSFRDHHYLDEIFK